MTSEKISVAFLLIFLLSCDRQPASSGQRSNPNAPVIQPKLIVMDGIIGMQRGRTIQFYDAIRDWKSSELPVFKIPDSTDEIIVMNGILGIRRNNRIRFYDAAQKWKRSVLNDFIIPDRSDVTIVMNGLLGVRRNNIIKFYTGPEWLPDQTLPDFRAE